MNIKHHTQPHMLEKYSFLWSEARLAIAAVALFLGGVPPLTLIPPPILYGLGGLVLTLSWIISGVASAYLLYRWIKSNKMLFGKKEAMDTVAFFVSIVSGFNLGLTGLSGTNPGMRISSNHFIFFVVAVIYLVSAYQLYRRWKTSGEKIFS